MNPREFVAEVRLSGLGSAYCAHPQLHRLTSVEEGVLRYPSLFKARINALQPLPLGYEWSVSWLFVGELATFVVSVMKLKPTRLAVGQVLIGRADGAVFDHYEKVGVISV